MSDVTELLQRWNSGDATARESLIDRIYAELSRIARGHLAKERHRVELQPTVLVHEAYMRLIDIDRIEWTDRAHFLAMAARIMREYLIDQARRRNAAKRDGGVQVTYTRANLVDDTPPTDVLALHDALERLAQADPDRARLVELRFFGGLTIEEIAEVMELSPSTVKRNWQVARGWLYRTMNEAES